MANAADEKQLSRFQRREERDLKLLVECFARVIDTMAGRVVLNYILENVTRTGGDPFNPDPTIHAHNAGRQAVSREVKQFIVEFVGTQYVKKLNDQRFEELAEEQLSREIENG